MNDYKPLTKGAVLFVSGTVEKLVKRDEQCKIVISYSNSTWKTVFADCYQSRDLIAARKIRKNSKVKLCGKVSSFGLSAICLNECSLID